MTLIESYFLIFLGIQLLHSIEELTNKFHLRFPFGKLKFNTFLTFEILFLSFWVVVFFVESIGNRQQLLAIFNVLMFANGIWHLTWFLMEKKYVPGIITAPFFIITFLIYYIELMSQGSL